MQRDDYLPGTQGGFEGKFWKMKQERKTWLLFRGESSRHRPLHTTPFSTQTPVPSVTFSFSVTPLDLLFSPPSSYVYVLGPTEVLLSSAWQLATVQTQGWIQINSKQDFCFCFSLLYISLLFFLSVLFHHEVYHTDRRVTTYILYSWESNNGWTPISPIKPPPKSRNRTETAPRNPCESLLKLSAPSPHSWLWG